LFLSCKLLAASCKEDRVRLQVLQKLQRYQGANFAKTKSCKQVSTVALLLAACSSQLAAA